VVACSEAWTVFARSNSRVMCSNHTQGMCVYVLLFCVCVVLCIGRCLGLADLPCKETYRLCTGTRFNKGL
jgi:hypothetical protein